MLQTTSGICYSVIGGIIVPMTVTFYIFRMLLRFIAFLNKTLFLLAFLFC